LDKGYLLDTHIVMAYFNSDASVRRHLKGVVSFVSAITAGELFHGITNSQSSQRNLTAMREFLEFQPLLLVDLETADQYGRLATELKRRGLPIRDNDVWIAAHALQHNLTVVTRDSDFDRLVELGVTVEKW
jgi:tRNA(fMet)-specific endonuclease VapC